MANPLLTDEQNRRLANQNSTYNQIMQGFAPVQQPQEDSWLGGLSRGAKAGLGGVGAGLLHAGQAAFGTDGSLAAGFDAMAKNNAQRREWDLADTLSLDYLTNPEGLAYGLGQIAGSMALPALFGAGVAAAVPTGGTSLLGTGALIGAAGAAPMAISEGGNTYAQGLQQGMTEDEAKKAGLTDAAIKLPFYMLSEGLSGKVAQGLISKGLLNAEGKSLGRRAAESGAKILGNAANEAYEEGTENRSSAYALGDQRISSLGNIFNPFDWNEEDKAQAVGVFTPTLALGALTGGAGHLRSRFDKKNSDVAEEIASEDGGTIEEAPNEENFWENKEAAKHSIQQAYADGLISKDDARVMLMKINDEELGEADKKRLKAREKQVAAAIESRRIQGYNDELDNYVNNYESGKEAFINAIGGQESGGDYGAVNGRTGASGKYQIMPENWSAWAEETGIGADAEMTPENQEIVARYKLGEYYDKYGARGAAIAWYAGEGALDYSEEALNRKQGNGDEPSINEYADSVLARMGNVADNARIDDSEENYFNESDSMGLPKLSAPMAKGFDVSHLIDEEAQDARELFGKKQDENIGKQNLGNDFFSNIKVEQDKRAKAIKDIARAVSQPNTFDELRNSIPSNYLEQMQKARAVVPVNNNAVGRPIPSQTGTALTMQRGRNGGLNTDELAIMQKYQGNPDAFNRQFKKSVEAVRDAVNRGDITPDVGRAYMQNLGNMYNTVAGTVQNDGVILQGQDSAIIKMLGNLRDKRRRGDTGALPSLLQENGNVDRSAAFANRNNPLAPLNLSVKTPKGWDKAEAEYVSTVEKGIDIALPKGVTVDAKSVKNKKTGKKEVELRFSGEKISDEFKKKLRAHGFNWNVGRKAWVAEENIVTKAVAEKLTQKDNGEVKNGKEETERIDKTEEKRGAEGDTGETKNSEAEQAEAEHVPESNQDEVNKKAVSVEENIANGQKAIERIIETHEDIENAMYRDDTGNIDFVWGREGTGAKFKHGYGLAHIIAKRNSENGNGIETAKKLVEVIAKGTKVERQESQNGDGEARLKIHYDGYTAVLSLSRDKNTWLLTGWEDNDAGSKKATVNASGEGYDSTTATTATPTLTRRNGETVASVTKSVAQPAENVKKINLPKGTTVDVSIVGDNSNIIQVKFNGVQGKGTGGIMGRAGYKWKSDKQVWQARKTEKAMDVAEQLGYKPAEEAKPQERDYELDREELWDTFAGKVDIDSILSDDEAEKRFGVILTKGSITYHNQNNGMYYIITQYPDDKSMKYHVDCFDEKGEYQENGTFDAKDADVVKKGIMGEPIRQQRLQESNERATQSLIAQNKDESVPGKRYIVRNKFFSVSILDGVIRVKDARKINPQDNQFNFSLSVEEYQRAAQESGNRLAGIRKLLKAKSREGLENWIEESPDERTKEVRKQQNDEATLVQANDEHFENAYPLIEKVLQKAGIEALDHQTLFERAKKQQNQGKQEYKYYLNARPADIGAVPKGFIRVDTEDKGGRYGAIYYDRQLNDTDVQQYELKSADDVEKEKQTPKKFMSFEAIDGNGKRVFAAGAISTRKDRDGRTLPENEVDEDTYQLAKEYGGYKDGRVVGVAFKDKEARDKFVEDMNQRATNTAENVVESNKDNTNEGGNNNGIDITGKLSSNDTGSRRAENEIRTTSSSEESSGSNGQGSRTLEGQSGRNGNNGVPGSRTAVGGKTSISKGSEQVSAVKENPARSAELSGSVVDSLQEQPNVDEGSTDKIVESVAGGRTDAADTVNQKVNEVVKENNLDRQRADRLRKTAKVMPFLSKIQFSNTDFVADRLADNGKQGVMITDGTGTGKTFSGLAIAKEMVEDGKENILIVTPSDSVNNQWANAAKDFFGIELSKLDNIQDAGKGAVITTYANLGANDALIKRDWDLVICDESHYLMNNEQGEKTAALAKLRQLTLHPRELRARAEERILPEEKLEARRTIAQAAKLKRKKGQLKASEEAIVEKAEKLQKEKADELSKEERVQVEAQVKDWEQLNTTEKPKVMFMSATPFAYVPDIDYAEGYLFDYPKVEGGSYNQPGNGFQQFMIEHFGYHMRYNKLTKPDKAVDNAVMEVEFHEWLRKTGALTGHELEIDKDYNRGFLLVDQGVGKKIDEGFEFLRNNHDKYRELEGVLNKQFDSRRRNYLLESIKARESVPIIQQYLKAGKKVVVFYETNVERESFNPFKFTQQTKELLQLGENRWASEEIQHEMDMFAKERPDLVNLNLDELSEPISIYREAFGDDAMFFNGRVSKNKRAEYVKAFNDDNSGKNLIFVQQDAGNAGISLHDTTGKHQRVLINIGIPRRPSYAIQIEGRIYRLGNKSNAIIRYLTTATNIENGLFAETVAGRASTAENLALGRRARGLRDSFKNAYQEIFDGTWEDRSPGIEGEDVGGKENDRNIVSTDSDYDRAKAFYFARGKKTAKNKAAEGVDYFATPEPVGYKMVQWAGLKDGDRVLEPSAGHGAISRFFSPTTENTIIEPSGRLAPQAQMNTENAKLINGVFEDLHISNKYDAITMNPPFGTGGKTAIEHLSKAFGHLREGGRVIALIPRGGMADKRFTKWYESDEAKNAHMVGEVLLPNVTFERAGTKVATRIVIIDKGGESQGVKRIDLSRINNINELFDNLESVEMPARQTKQVDAGPANFANSLRKGDAEDNSEVVTADSYKHTKTGAIIPSAKLNANLSDEEYRKVKSIAGKNGGYYSRYAKAFLFQDNETGRDKFVEEVNGANNTQYSVTSEAVQRAKEEVEAEIRAAFPNGKVEYVNGVPTITMPNGSKFQYSIRENIVVNAKEQRKADAAHGTSGARVQGYWKKFSGNGVQRMLAVAQNSERGTAFHEAMHAAADLALTEKEKNALYNYYQKQADKQGRDVNEVMADAYRDWVLARQRKSGTMFGKLWRKVKDFCTRIKALFDKGAEVERIMQDIESGRVYERGTNNHSVTKRIFFSTESINPNEEYIQGINDTDPGKVNTLAKSFEDKGYVGRPVLLVENGNEGYIALTGSHRIEAAKQADVDLKAIVLENNEDTAQLIEARDDDERENIAKQLYEEGAISKSVYDVIREENESNGTYYSVASPKHKIANAFTNTERKGVVDSVKDFFTEHRKSLYQDWFDKNNPLKGFDALTKATGGLSVYDQVQSLPATTAGMLKALTEGTAQHVKMANQHLKNVKMKYNVTLAMALEKIDKKQMDKAYPKYLAENGFDNWVNALGAYLGAERCLEMAQLARAEGKTYKFPKGLTEQECQAFVNKAPQQFKAAADIFYKVNDNVISIMEDAEVFSHDLAKTLRTKYRKYCPLLRDFSDTAAADSFIGGLTEGGRGIGNVSVPLKRINIEGSERGVLNPLETILKSYAVMLNRAERNKVALMAVENSRSADLHELIQEVPGTTADPKNCVFTVLINGKKKAYKTTQDLYGPIVGYNLPAANLAFGVARTAARMLRTGATMSPSFILRNVLRDTVFAGISSKNGFIPLVDTIRGAIALAKDPAMRAEFEAAGVTEYNFYSSQKSRIKSLDAMAGETPASAWEIMKAVFSRLEATSDFFESSTRMGEYMKARQKGLSMEEAARAAREVTLDFSRSGRVGEQVNQVVPFFNACLQGGDKMVRLFREDFVGTSLKVLKYIVLPSLLIMAMNWDEDWYKDLDPDIKNNYWCVGRNIRIPKPQEAGVLFGSGIEALFQQAADKDKDAVENWLKAFSSNMIPGIVPTLFLPILEWQANYSYFKGRQLVGSKYQRLPDELQYNDYTSELSKGIGSTLKVSPMKIDNLVRGYTGTMGALLWGAAGEPFAKANNLPAKHFNEILFVRDFNVTDANLSRPMNEFYGILDKANRQHAGYGVKGKPEAAVKGIRSAGAMISKIRKDIDKITHSNLTPERKRELIDKRKEKMNQIAKQANARYGKYFD